MAIYNDTAQPVVIWTCARESCSKLAEHETFAAGERGGAFAVSSAGVPTVVVVVELKTHKRLGCLPFVVPKLVDHVLVGRVSRAVPCRKSYDDNVQWPPRSE